MKYNTKCNKCIFRIDDENNTQHGCQFNIQQILDNNYPGLYSINNIDKSSNSWTIKDFRCPYARTREWAEFIAQNNSNIDMFDKVIEENLISYYLVVLLNSSEDDIEDILEDISKDKKYSPAFISFVLSPHSNYKPAQCIELINSYKLSSQWKLHSIVDPESTISEMIDIALLTNLDFTTATMIIIKYGNTPYKTDLIKRSTEIINHCNGKQVALLSEDFIDGFTIPTSLYKSMNNQIGLVYDYISNDETIYKLKII